jgi:ribonuclease HI
MGVVVALQSLTKQHIPVTIYTDSKYIVDSVEKKWLDGWVKNDFKGGKKNKDLWLKYYELSKQFKVSFKWVRGHADNPYNNRCDELATTAADNKQHLLIDEEYELLKEQ